MGKKKPRTAEKEAAYQAKQEVRRAKIMERNRLQEPIKKNLKARNCPNQEIGNLFRSQCSDILLKHQNPVPVRFCYLNYPDEWIRHNKEAAAFMNFVPGACQRYRVKKPLYTNALGGYVLYLMEDEASAQFVRGLLPELAQATGVEMREPTLAEITTFHAGWEERSPNMFSKRMKGGELRQPKKPKKG